jgi:hypothetical protein
MSGHAATPVPGQISDTHNYVWNTNTLSWDAMVQPGGTGGGAGYETVWLKNVGGTRVNPATNEAVQALAGFAPAGGYDEVVLGYTGSNLTTVTYKLATAVVGTLTLAYSGSTLTGVVRT